MLTRILAKKMKTICFSVRHAYRAYLKLDRRIAHPLLSAGDPRASAAGQGYFCGSGAQPFGDGFEIPDVHTEFCTGLHLPYCWLSWIHGSQLLFTSFSR
jgi:hypothetical protein